MLRKKNTWKSRFWVNTVFKLYAGVYVDTGMLYRGACLPGGGIRDKHAMPTYLTHPCSKATVTNHE